MRLFQSFKRLIVVQSDIRNAINKNFSNSNNLTRSNDGLFGCERLLKADDFAHLSKQTKVRTDELIQLIRSVSQSDTYQSNKDHARLVLYLLDSISNEICNVVDAAELCRNIHNDDTFKHAAEMAFTEVSSLIHNLNANESIYAIIKNIHDEDCKIRKSAIKTENDVAIVLSSEERMFLNDLKTEFECEGIHLSSLKKNTLLQLQNDIVSIETAFLKNVSVSDNQIFPLKPVSKFHSASIRNWINNSVQIDDQITADDDSVLCSSNKRVSLVLLKSLQDEESRKNLYYQTCFEPFDNLFQLGRLIQKRRQLGELLDYKSYSHKFLAKQTIKTPAQVMSSTEQLSRVTRSQAESELELLRALKFQYQYQPSSILPSDVKMCPWDISFYSAMHTNIIKEKAKRDKESSHNILHHRSLNTQHINSYFSLKHCLKGLIMITKELFNIDFIQSSMMLYESWDEGSSNNNNGNNKNAAGKKFDVKNWLSSFSSSTSSNNKGSDLESQSLNTGIFKFNAYRNTSSSSSSSSSSINEENKVGTVYLDLFQRPIEQGQGKFSGSAMFTVAGGCRKSYHEQQVFKYPDKSSNSSNNMDFSSIEKSIPYQLPRVALVLNIPPPSSSSSTISASTTVGPLLTLHEVETLHHEWGHMLHSLLSHTSFQHLSGTRTAMDFSEVPSHLFEYFARTPSVVCEWARHVQTNERLPEELLIESLSYSSELKALDLQAQILYSAADQYIFGISSQGAASYGSNGNSHSNKSASTANAADTFWSTIPGICSLQQSLTCLPLADNPIDDIQSIISQRTTIGTNDIRNSSSNSSSSRSNNSGSTSSSSYNTESLMSVQQDMERHGITHLPAMMPCSHNHFVSYGAGYYSYLFARMYAAQIWERKFAKNPLSRESGQYMWENMLQYGASKDPQFILDTMAEGPLDPTYFLKQQQQRLLL